MNQAFQALIAPKWRVFFALEGLTQAEANHKANLIKEKCTNLTALFESTAAYTAVMDFEGQPVKLDSFKSVDSLREQALVEGTMYAASAWLREAIQAKVEVLKDIKIMPVSLLGYDEEELKFDLLMPSMDRVTPLPLLTEDDIKAEWTIKERAEYLELESMASHLGKKIHKDGIIAKIRKDSKKQKSTGFKELPNGTGLKTYLVQYTPLYEAAKLEEDFFHLQEQHRSFESKLNYLKAKLQNELTTRNADITRKNTDEQMRASTEYNSQMREYNEAYRAHNAKVRDFNARMEARRLELTKYASALKIAKPEALVKIIDSVN